MTSEDGTVDKAGRILPDSNQGVKNRHFSDVDGDNPWARFSKVPKSHL